MQSFSVRSSYRLLVCALFFFLTLGAAPRVQALTGAKLVIHYIESQPTADQSAYPMDIFLSVLDSANNPVDGLTVEDFTVLEDSRMVSVDSVDLAETEPNNLILVVDTSWRMVGDGIRAARSAASRFVKNLGQEDRIAVIKFNETVTTVIDFTKDHQKASDQIALINAESGTGTCLYDALYTAAQMSTSLPEGRRAIVVISSGKDDYKGSPCSAYTLEDVLNIATDKETRVPIYTVGLGTGMDTPTLDRLAQTTGGIFLASPGMSQLDVFFQLLTDQLNSQYLLRYMSHSPSGDHSLTVKATTLLGTAQDMRNFTLPVLGPGISFLTPKEGDSISGVVTISISPNNVVDPIDHAVFQIDGEDVGTDDTAPYSLDWDFSRHPVGNATVTALLIGENGQELARNAISVVILAAPTPTPTAVFAVAQETTPIAEESAPAQSPVFLIGGVGLAALVILGLVLFLALRRRNLRRKAKAEQGGQEKTSAGTLGVLVVQQSHDSKMVGRRFELSKPITKLGRGVENDVVFSKDSAVSRIHAQIEFGNGELFLSEVPSKDKDGIIKPPAHGTFLNNIKIASKPVVLHHRDEIRLGNRVRILFEAVQNPSPKEIAPGDDSGQAGEIKEPSKDS